jgi:hypothetical protein
MAKLKHIGPGSAVKLGAITYAFVGLVIGIIAACVSLVAGSLAGMGGSGMGLSARTFGFGMGVGAIIVAPIVYGIIGESARDRGGGLQPCGSLGGRARVKHQLIHRPLKLQYLTRRPVPYQSGRSVRSIFPFLTLRHVYNFGAKTLLNLMWMLILFRVRQRRPK